MDHPSERPSPPPPWNRDLSWLSYDSLVLASSLRGDVSLRSALDFVGYHTSNLDEFYSVRGAEYRKAAREGGRVEDVPDATATLRAINETVTRQMQQATHILATHLSRRLREAGVTLHMGAEDLTAAQREAAARHFERAVVPNIQPVLLGMGTQVFLRHNQPYLAVRLHPRANPVGVAYSLLKIPVKELPRFVQLPGEGGQRHLAWVDDVMRLHLAELYPGFFVQGAWAIKISRDADLGISDDFDGDLAEEIRDSLVGRKTGLPAVLYHDAAMAPDLLRFLCQQYGFRDYEMVGCGPYLNLQSLLSLPLPEEAGVPVQAVPPRLRSAPSLLDEVERGDLVLHFPYHPFDYVVRLLNEAARDRDVTEVKITQYRVATNSAVVESLIAAARANKRVTVVVELRARFDEGNNLRLAERMAEAGIHIIYSRPTYKVHAKVALIERGEGRAVSYVSTGNFNEQTARTYTDHGLLTADPSVAADLRDLFGHLETGAPVRMRSLLVTQVNMERELLRLIRREADLAGRGEPAEITLKLNGLQYRPLIEALAGAALAGVRVRAVVRSICCVPPDEARHMRLRRIIDVWLEHGRIYSFGPRGERGLYISSGDWLNRNFRRRIEVAAPVANAALRAELQDMLELELADNASAWDVANADARVTPRPGDKAVRSQREILEMLRRKANS